MVLMGSLELFNVRITINSNETPHKFPTMASIQKVSKGYRAQVYVKGVRDSKLFTTRRAAVDWANQRELDLKDTRPLGSKHTLLDAFHKYSKEISPKKRGERWEIIRLKAFEGYLLPLDKAISDVSSSDIALFRDSRLRAVSVGSVLREMTMLTSVFEAARRDWGWISINPCKDVRKPPRPNHRERTIQWHEIRALLRTMKYSPGLPKNKVQAMANCFLLALATGMRAGELCSLTWSNVFDDHVYLPATKNGMARQVPLSTKARSIINNMRGWREDSVFGFNTEQLSSLFRKYRTMAGLSGFTFHDSRHSAATMLAKKVDALTLCKIMGWRDPKFALVYYNPTASDIAARLG